MNCSILPKQGSEAMKGLKHVGENTIIREWVRFVRPENIHLGNHVMIDDFVLLSGGREELTEIGNYVHIACFSSIIGSGGVTMKDFSGLSPGCRLFDETDDYVD
jgi:dTDP-4-amino-4,6-dideoxy-D-glucose acyltransferase